MTVHADRLARLRARMAEPDTDFVALGPTSHMRWLAGLDRHGDERPVMLIVSQQQSGLLMPALNAASARQATDLSFYEQGDATGPDGAEHGGCCQTDANQSLFGQVRPASDGAELPPLGQSGGAGLLVGWAA